MKNWGRFVLALWILAAVAGTVSGLIEHRDGRATVLGISPDAWIAIATLLMFLATVALAYIAYNQYTTSQAQTRAYVGIEGGYMRYVELLEGGRGFAIHIEIRNYGQTPGYHLTSWVKRPAILPSDSVPFGEPVSIADRLGSSIIGPQSNVSLDWTISVSDDQLSTLKAGTHKIFVWGGVDFKDAFRADRHFVFRIISGNAGMIKTPVMLHPCSRISWATMRTERQLTKGAEIISHCDRSNASATTDCHSAKTASATLA